MSSGKFPPVIPAKAGIQSLSEYSLDTPVKPEYDKPKKIIKQFIYYKFIFKIMCKQKTTMKGGETMNNKKGFTLVELLVVIVIIGILATLATIALGSARTKARDARRVSDIKQIQTALELYYSDASKYPTATTTVSVTNIKALPYDPLATYMPSIPAESNTSDCTATGTYISYEYTPRTSAGATDFGASKSPVSYTIEYCLGNVTGDISAGFNTATPSSIK